MPDLLLAYESLIAFVFINGLLALSVYATLCCGQLSLANAGFMAIGAYTGALITLRAPAVPFFLVLAASALLPAIVAVPFPLSRNVTPAGRPPASVKLDVGKPLVVIVNDPGALTRSVALFALVNAGA